jgi:hypothetical protein
MLSIFKNSKNYRKVFHAFLGLSFLIICLFSSNIVAEDTQGEARQELLSKDFEMMKANASKMSLTIFPIILAERPFKNVAEVAALMFEKANVKEIEVPDEAFLPTGKDIWEISDSFGEFVHAQSLKTDYALFGEYVGTRETGVQEVRSIIVDREGNPVWVDRQTPEDKLFKKIKPQDPMNCTVLLVERVRSSLGLPDPDRKDAPEGKWAAHWKKDSDLPAEKEFKAMDERLKLMSKKYDNFKNAKVLVYPVHHHDKWNQETAVRLAEVFNEKDIFMAEAAPAEIRFEIKGSSNEQKILWDLAMQFRNYLKKNKVEADAALIGQYFIGEKGVGAVHFVLCDQEGEWVIVDFQNDHHKDFQELDPKTASDCDRLVVKRLEDYLKK